MRTLVKMSNRTVSNHPHVDIFIRNRIISNFHFSAKNLHFTRQAFFDYTKKITLPHILIHAILILFSPSIRVPLLLYSIPSGMQYIGFVHFPIILIILIILILPPTQFECNSSKTAEQNYTKLKTHMAHISKQVCVYIFQ